MRLYFPVDLTGNMNMIEKLEPGISWSSARRANLCAIKSRWYGSPQFQAGDANRYIYMDIYIYMSLYLQIPQ